MLTVKAKVGELSLKGISPELGWRKKGIPEEGTKKESLGGCREQLMVQLGKITGGRRHTVWGAVVSQRRALNARLKGLDVLQIVAHTFEGSKVK